MIPCASKLYAIYKLDDGDTVDVWKERIHAWGDDGEPLVADRAEGRLGDARLVDKSFWCIGNRKRFKFVRDVAASTVARRLAHKATNDGAAETPDRLTAAGATRPNQPKGTPQ